jgi:hypothetical protein
MLGLVPFPAASMFMSVMQECWLGPFLEVDQADISLMPFPHNQRVALVARSPAGNL